MSLPPSQVIKTFNAVAVVAHLQSVSLLRYCLISWRIHKLVKIVRFGVKTLDRVTWL